MGKGKGKGKGERERNTWIRLSHVQSGRIVCLPSMGVFNLLACNQERTAVSGSMLGSMQRLGWTTSSWGRSWGDDRLACQGNYPNETASCLRCPLPSPPGDRLLAISRFKPACCTCTCNLWPKKFYFGKLHSMHEAHVFLPQIALALNWKSAEKYAISLAPDAMSGQVQYTTRQTVEWSHFLDLKGRKYPPG